MPTHFRVSSLVPSGLIVDSVAHIEDTIIVTARAGIEVAMCPLCRSPSRRVHSRYKFRTCRAQVGAYAFGS
jgi:hypothetical protein